MEQDLVQESKQRASLDLCQAQTLELDSANFLLSDPEYIERMRMLKDRKEECIR